MRVPERLWGALGAADLLEASHGDGGGGPDGDGQGGEDQEGAGLGGPDAAEGAGGVTDESSHDGILAGSY